MCVNHRDGHTSTCPYKLDSVNKSLVRCTLRKTVIRRQNQQILGLNSWKVEELDDAYVTDKYVVEKCLKNGFQIPS